MPDKLTEIMAWKRQEIAALVRPVSDRELRALDAEYPKPPSFRDALRQTDGKLAVIAEIKRRSPSAGDIAAGISATEQALKYRAAGANALSVLTDFREETFTLDLPLAKVANATSVEVTLYDMAGNGTTKRLQW